MKQTIQQRIQSIADKINRFILIEDSEITLNEKYSTASGHSSYLSYEYDDKVFTVRISDHKGHQDSGGFQHEIIVDQNEPVRFCSTVMLIVYKIRGGE